MAQTQSSRNSDFVCLLFIPLVIDQRLSTGAHTQVGRDWPHKFPGKLAIADRMGFLLPQHASAVCNLSFPLFLALFWLRSRVIYLQIEQSCILSSCFFVVLCKPTNTGQFVLPQTMTSAEICKCVAETKEPP